MIDELRVENSMPVQSRVDARDLAELALFYEGQGNRVNTYSQLVSWGINLCVEVLVVAKMIKGRRFNNAVEAHRYLDICGLKKQGSLKNRVNSKVLKAKAYAELRLDGADPKFEDPSGYNQIHNRGTFEDQPHIITRKGIPTQREIDADWNRLQREKMIEEAKERDKKVIEEMDFSTVKLECRVKDSVVDQIKEERDEEVSSKMQIQKEIFKSQKFATPRQLTKEELDAKAAALEKKERDYLKALDNMNEAPKATA